MKGANSTYLGNIREGFASTWKGLVLTLKHLWQARERRDAINVESASYFKQETGIVTLEYPHEAIPVPDHGRYRLHNEIDDCIVCDLCAKICPVNCIEIEPVKATAEIGKTSDGSTKRIYAGTFNIDMAKCCYCGLCTTVCPTECLTMTKTYDYSEFDVRNMVYHFSEMTEEEVLEKKQAYEKQQAEKAAAKKTAAPSVPPVAGENTAATETPKPAFKPKLPGVKPAAPAQEGATEKPQGEGKDDSASTAAKPVFKPKITGVKPATEKPTAPTEQTSDNSATGTEESKPAPKPVFKPKIAGVKPVVPPVSSTKDDAENAGERKAEESGAANEIPAPAPKPVYKPKIPTPKKPTDDSGADKNLNP